MAKYLQFLNPEQILKDIDLEAGMTIADFGAGSGYMSFKAAKLVGKNGSVDALDVKKSIIEHLQNEIKHQNLSNVKAVWTNLELINHNPIKDQSVDLVLIVNMLFQSNKHYQILKEAWRQLKSGGKILIIDWEKQATPFGPPKDERVDLEKLKQTAYSLGLNKIREFKPGPYHFGLVFKK
jgi:ubiquinone/menaquinone biosynthesis C-methylase UbiE